YPQIEKQYNLDFKTHFAEDLQLLQPMADDGLVEIRDDALVVTPRGRLLIRNICMCFDTYLRNQMRQRQFSRVI
ncbi:oxygen-independent coproporphyrinogen III oxidase, partial [Klebsiella pneumoniae]|nr:oxygen-independent coproporphyrinogen III oxidase [Klebsiella pneumoniae]